MYFFILIALDDIRGFIDGGYSLLLNNGGDLSNLVSIIMINRSVFNY